LSPPQDLFADFLSVVLQHGASVALEPHVLGLRTHVYLMANGPCVVNGRARITTMIATLPVYSGDYRESFLYTSPEFRYWSHIAHRLNDPLYALHVLRGGAL
jgi:hypothetical protein